MAGIKNPTPECEKFISGVTMVRYCKGCTGELPEGAKNCMACGDPQRMVCVKCKKSFGGEGEPDITYCPNCRTPEGTGVRLQPGLAKRPAFPANGEPKRKTTRNNPEREPNGSDVINPKPDDPANPEGYVSQGDLAKALKEHTKNLNLDKDRGTPLSLMCHV